MAAAAAPTSAANVITIRNTHTASVTGNITLNQLVVESGGALSVNGGVTLSISNAAGTDLNVTGTVNNTGTINPTGTIVFNAGSTYNHTRNGGDIPIATWNPASDCNITGVTNSEPGGKDQPFGNFTWNSPSQSGVIAIWELADGGSVAGDFSVTNTGSSYIRISNTSSPTFTVGGNFNINGGSFYQTVGDGDPVIDIGGDLNISSGLYNMSSAGGTTTVNLTGDFNMTGGTLTESVGGGNGTIYFENTGSTQNFRRSGGTISNTINFTVNTNVTIDFGASDIANGSGTFTLSNGATLQTANTSGINGSIQTTGGQSLSTSANYTFNGSAAQNTGSNLPATVNNFTINNASGVTTFVSGTYGKWNI